MNATHNGHQPDCAALADLIPAYSIGATDPHETQMVVAALPDCPELRALLASYQHLADDLAYDVPQVTPPARLRANLMAALRAPAPAPRRPLPWRTGALLAVAALLVASNLGWWLRLEAVTTPPPPATAAVGWVAFTPLTDEAEPSIVMIWDTRTGTATLYADGLPALAADESYQLWLLRDEARVSAGVFEQDAAGQGVLIFDIPASLDTFTALGITTEPRGGSPAPTTAPVAQALLQ